jgi:catechol 2,3-dioxygenase-like lactoylglutathione lyase family enzyme
MGRAAHPQTPCRTFVDGNYFVRRPLAFGRLYTSLIHQKKERSVPPIKPRGVVHFSIPVSDLDASRTFYVDLLGLTFLRESPAFQMMFLSAGKDYIVLAKSETPIRPNAEGSRRVHHAFAVEPHAYETAKEFLRENGVKIIDEEFRNSGTFPGRQFYIHDPDGNVIELSEFAGKEY